MIMLFFLINFITGSILFILGQAGIIPNINYSNIYGQQVSLLEAVNFIAISLQLMGILCLFLYFKDKFKRSNAIKQNSFIFFILHLLVIFTIKFISYSSYRLYIFSFLSKFMSYFLDVTINCS